VPRRPTRQARWPAQHENALPVVVERQECDVVDHLIVPLSWSAAETA
jgi:hypothetical protein